MSALKFLNTLRESDKMRGLPSILLHFHNKFNKFNNTGARMLDWNQGEENIHEIKRNISLNDHLYKISPSKD